MESHENPETFFLCFCFSLKIPMLQLVQLNKYETEPYFLQFFQSSTTVCVIIYMFYKSCEHECEPEIVLKIKTVIKIKTKNNFTFMFKNLTKSVNQHCCALEILKKISICLIFI